MNEFVGFDPDGYLEMVTGEVPAYGRLQERLAAATAAVGGVARILDLGTGTGETARRVLALHPDAELVGLDESETMLAGARERLPGAELIAGRLEDPLPAGQFELAVSALAVHHLDGPGKADLFGRVAGALAPGGRFVLADIVVPTDPADAVTEIDGEHDTPSSVAEQLRWLRAAGLEAETAWAERDLAVIAADRPPRRAGRLPRPAC